VQDINIGGRLTAAEYQYTLTDPSLSELNKWGPIVMNALAKLPQLTDVTRSAILGDGAFDVDRPGHRRPSLHHGVDYR
ncbi:MAG: hypothetical protein WAV18_30970, partial [Roseiarcus sp.]